MAPSSASVAVIAVAVVAIAVAVAVAVAVIAVGATLNKSMKKHRRATNYCLYPRLFAPLQQPITTLIARATSTTN